MHHEEYLFVTLRGKETNVSKLTIIYKFLQIIIIKKKEEEEDAC
jgi:hypothetical protein